MRETEEEGRGQLRGKSIKTKGRVRGREAFASGILIWLHLKQAFHYRPVPTI